MQTRINAPSRSVRITRLCLFLILGWCWTSPVYSQSVEEDSGPKPEKPFESNETFNITITAPWKDIVRKVKVKDPYPASM